MRTILKWLFGAFLIGIIMGLVTNYTNNDFWLGFITDGLAIMALFLFCVIFLFIIMPAFVPELYKK